MKRRVFLIIITAVLCFAAASFAAELTFSQTCRQKTSRATQLYTDPEGNGQLVASTMLPAGTYLITNGKVVDGLTGITYSSNDRNVLYGYIDGSAITSATTTITLPSGKKVTVGEALVKSRTALNLWLSMEYGETLDGSTYKDENGEEHDIGNESALEDESSLDGDARWARAMGGAYGRNGTDVRTVYHDDEGNEKEVQVCYMGLARSKVIMDGEEQMVETWRLTWDTDASADKVLAVTMTFAGEYRVWDKPQGTKTVLFRVRSNRVLQVIKVGRSYTLVDTNEEGMPLGYIANDNLEFLPNVRHNYESAKITVKGNAKGHDPVGIRAEDSGNARKITEFDLGEILSVYAQNNKWSEVDVGGYHAFILNEFVTLDKDLPEGK